MLPALLQIGDILLSTDIVTEWFACDYPVCRGVCCIEGDSGAPMDILDGMDEASALEAAHPSYRALLDKEGEAVLSSGSFSVIDRDGDTVTPLVPGSGKCAYCHTDPSKGLTCAVEMAGCRKPLSCSLYPIRVKRLSSGIIALNLHRWEICRCAFEKGKREGIRVYEFLKGPLTAAFGEEFYSALCYFEKKSYICSPQKTGPLNY